MEIEDAIDDLGIGDPPTLTTEVDGAPAVINGATGAVAEPLVTVDDTDDSVLSDLAHCMEAEARLRTAANKAKNALTAASKKTKAAAEHAAAHWAKSRQVELVLTTGGTVPDGDDEEEE
jgi:molybdopterin biosynthesis enzyme MoaB